MGAVRMTRRGKYTSPTAQRYLHYKRAIGYDLLRQRQEEPLTGPLEVNIKFVMPIPPSWSGKKQREAVGQPHVKKADIDNLVKGAFDAANKILWADDNQVFKISAYKVYGDSPYIEMEIIEH